MFIKYLAHDRCSIKIFNYDQIIIIIMMMIMAITTLKDKVT